jgi:D-threo-aldose 1-dehydrogenase
MGALWRGSQDEAKPLRSENACCFPVRCTLSPVPSGKAEIMALTFPPLGLGTAPFGVMEEAQAVATAQAALENGIKLIDTAPMYGSGRSERFVGAALRGVPRDSYVLSTKVGRVVVDGEWRFDYSKDGIRRSVEDSLGRLGVDRIDILLMHDPDDHYQEALENAYPVLDELRSQGVIGALGAGMNQWEMEEDFATNATIDVFLLAGRYTLIEQHSLGFLERCRERGNKIMLGGVFNSGILAGGSRSGATYQYAAPPPAIVTKVEMLEAVCARHGVALPAAALQFARANPAITTLLFGAQSPDEVKSNLELLQAPIPAAFWEELRAEGLVDAAAPLP